MAYVSLAEPPLGRGVPSPLIGNAMEKGNMLAVSCSDRAGTCGEQTSSTNTKTTQAVREVFS